MKYVYTPEENRVIALEGIRELIEAGNTAALQVKSKLLEIFPNLSNGFSSRDKLDKLPEFNTSDKEKKKFLDHIKTTHYAELRELRTYVPEGLSVGYLAYGKTLLAASLHLKNIASDVVHPYTLFLAHLMSNKGMVISTDSHSIEHDKSEHNRKELYISLNSCFGNKFEVETTVGKVVERNADWLEIFKDVDSIFANLTSIDRAKIREMSAQCDDYLNVIHTQLKEGKMDQITPEIGEALVRGAWQVAEELECLSIIYYRAIAYNAALDRTLVKLDEVLS